MKISKFLKMLPFALVACMLLSTVSAFAETTVKADDVSAKTEQVTVLVSGVTAGEEVAIMVYDKAEGVTPANVAADNIWYIDQAAADSEGKVTFEFYLKADATDATKTVAVGSAKADAATYDTFEVKAAASYTLGDVNNDGKINRADVTILRRYIAGGYTINTFVVNAANINGDENDDGTPKIDRADVTHLRRHIATGYPSSDKFFEK